MAYRCPACGCRCGYDKRDAVKDVTSHQVPLKTHNLCVEESAPLQCSALPLSAVCVISAQRTVVANERTNKLSEACLATDVIQGCTLDVIQSKLSMKTLPDGFVCNRMSDKILLYKLDISRGLIVVECGIILTSDFQVTCSSYNDVLLVSIYEDLLSQGKQITSISQLLNLMNRLSRCGQDHIRVKIESDVDFCEENYRAVIEACDTKLEKEETVVCAVSENLIAQSFLSENYLSEGCESKSITKGAFLVRSDSNVTIDSVVDFLSPEISIEDDSLRQDVEEAKLFLPSLNVSSKEINSVASFKSQTHSTCLCSTTTGTMTVERTTNTRGATSLRQSSGNRIQCSRCSLCMKKFCRVHSLNRHIQRVHQSERYHCCTKCEKSFSTRTDLIQHIKHVHKKSKTDKEEFSSSQQMKSGISSTYFKKKSHKCPQCDSCFSSESRLIQHLRAAHNLENPYQCSSCDKKFSTRQCRNYHFKSVHCCEVKRLSCDRCDTTFANKGNLKEHVRSVHDGLRLYPCTECPYKSATNKGLKRHLRAVHQREKHCLCTECGKSFSCPSDLKSHVDAVHRGLKPFPCTECKSSFSKNWILMNHIRAVHLKEKPHSCSVCSKSFFQMSDVRQHVDFVHNGNKPFKCQQCSYSFTRRVFLSNHMRTQHQMINSLLEPKVRVN